MLKIKDLRGFIIGVIFALTLTGTVVGANAIVREIVYGVAVNFDGRTVQFDDDSRPFIMDGRTFLPVRAVAELTGLSVDYSDGVVYLSSENVPISPPIPAPVPTPTQAPTPTAEPNLVGRWSFVSAPTFLYYFYGGADIEFFADGGVMEYSYNEPGRYTTRGSNMTVVGEWTDTYQFTFNIVGDMLYITDSDNDTGIWQRGGSTPAPTSTTPAPTPTPTPSPVQTDQSQYEQRVLELVNAERANHGLGALQWCPSLAAAARAHSVDMYENNFMSHTGSNGSTPWDRMANAGASYGWQAENVASGQATPEEVMHSWMNSPGHRSNILSPDYTHLGVGYSHSRWTQKFGG
ncbi:MAG: CAP domain-containing protein [Defluviitaleaceae bacterium]|nr:CAP domain-containing protein [Defluviitaleaceae bacterium]